MLLPCFLWSCQIGGGSLRIYKRDVQQKVLEIVGISQEQVSRIHNLLCSVIGFAHILLWLLFGCFLFHPATVTRDTTSPSSSQKYTYCMQQINWCRLLSCLCISWSLHMNSFTYMGHNFSWFRSKIRIKLS